MPFIFAVCDVSYQLGEISVQYLNSKNVGRLKDGDKKPKSLKAISLDQFRAILQAVHDSEPINENWRRDYALIYLGGALGMRVGEIALYERSHFSDLEKYDVIHVPTLKQSEKITFVCPGMTHEGEYCGRKSRVKLSSAGQMHKCFRCGKSNPVPKAKNGATSTGIVLIDVDIVEDKTRLFILDYLDEIPADQRWLFESSNPKYHLSKGHISKIFNTFAAAVGLDPKISFHSLRHCRGVTVYSQFKDMVLCKSALRHKNVATTQIYADLDLEQKQHYREELNKKAFDPLKRKRSK